MRSPICCSLFGREQSPKPRFFGVESGKNDHYSYSDRRNKKSPSSPLSPCNAQRGTKMVDITRLYLHVGTLRLRGTLPQRPLRAAQT
jgi:hypothetical protein